MERFFVLELDGKEAIVPMSSVRRCFPVESQVSRGMCSIVGGCRVVSKPSDRNVNRTRENNVPHSHRVLGRVLTQFPSQLTRVGTLSERKEVTHSLSFWRTFTKPSVWKNSSDPIPKDSVGTSASENLFLGTSCCCFGETDEATHIPRYSCIADTLWGGRGE